MYVPIHQCSRKQVIGMIRMMCMAYLLLIAQLASAATEEKTSPETPDSPYETQTAQCTITSGDIEASAQASISKTLVGVCGTDEMLESFRILESKMLEEMYNLRKMIRDPYFNPPPLRRSVYKSIKRTTTSTNTSSNTALPQSTGLPTTVETAEGLQTAAPLSNNKNNLLPAPSTTTSSAMLVFPDDNYDDNYEDEHSELVKSIKNSYNKQRISLDDKKSSLVSAPIDFKPIDKPTENKFIIGGLRDHEVYRFNNTVISSGDAKIFKYFWKIENFTKRIRASTHITEATFSSPVFVISGLNLRLIAKTTNKSNDEVVYMQLEQLSASDDALQKTPNVILASGALYGQVKTNSFFRHKIMILNQDNPFSDLISTDLTNTNAKFEAPLSALTTEPYLKDDKLLIKVIIFL